MFVAGGTCKARVMGDRPGSEDCGDIPGCVYFCGCCRILQTIESLNSSSAASAI